MLTFTDKLLISPPMVMLPNGETWDRRGGLSSAAQFDRAAFVPGDAGLHAADIEGTQPRRSVQAEYPGTGATY